MSNGVVNIVGVGSTLMGDDGVGSAVVEALARREVPDGVRLHDAGLAVSDVLGRLAPGETLIVVDALRAGGRAGQIYRACLDDMRPEGGRLHGCLSLHELSVLPALRMEALSGREFKDVTVFGVEPETVAWGEGLSPVVAAAAERLAGAILEYIDARHACAAAGEPSP